MREDMPPAAAVGSAQWAAQSMCSGGMKPSVASWSRRMSAPRSESATSVIAQAGYGGSGTSPSMYDTTSRPSSSTPR